MGLQISRGQPGHPLAADQEAQTFPCNFLHFLLLLAAL